MRSQCQCGDISIEIHTTEHSSMNCHCNMCRERSGAAFTTWVTVDIEKVDLPEVSSSITKYQVSDNTETHFCSKCGTHVYALDRNYKGIVAFLAGTIKGIELNKPTGDYFYSDKACWYETGTELPKYGGESGFDKLDSE